MQSCHESISSSILMYLTLRRATCHVSTVAAGHCRRTLQAATGHYTVILLWRLMTVINVLRHSCGQGDWQLTELNYTYSKDSNNITRNSVLWRSVTWLASCGVLWSLDGPAAAGSVFLWRLLYGRNLHTACDCCACVKLFPQKAT